MEEKITCSAIHYYHLNMTHWPKNVKWLVIYWHRHSQCYELFGNMIGLDEVLHEDVIQWFITNTHRFVWREEWWEIARKAKQLICKRDEENWVLMSEDLY